MVMEVESREFLLIVSTFGWLEMWLGGLAWRVQGSEREIVRGIPLIGACINRVLFFGGYWEFNLGGGGLPTPYQFPKVYGIVCLGRVVQFVPM